MKRRRRSPTSLIAGISTLALSAAAIAQADRFAVQIEALSVRAAADARVEQLGAQGVEAYLVESLVPGKGLYFRVRVGDFATREAAEHLGQQLKAQGTVRDFFVAAYESPAPPSQPEPIPASQPAATPATAVDPPLAPAATTPPGDELPAPAAYARYQDADVGFSFEYPQNWVGRPLSTSETLAQRVTAGAMFKSNQDTAFLNATWNELVGANSSKRDNESVVDMILQSMASGSGTRNLEALSRRVVQDGPRIKTFLELDAAFESPTRSEPLEFLAKGVIIRADKGILLLVAFYSKDAPQTAAVDADHIVQTAQVPD